jgi:hypothetical protein
MLKNRKYMGSRYLEIFPTSAGEMAFKLDGIMLPGYGSLCGRLYLGNATLMGNEKAPMYPHPGLHEYFLTLTSPLLPCRPERAWRPRWSWRPGRSRGPRRRL